MDNDKQTEYLRYDARALSMLMDRHIEQERPEFGALQIPLIYRAPYVYYEQCVRRYISKEHDVLEIGSGTGLHTQALVQQKARVVASDISNHSLKVLEQKNRGVNTLVADMESLPFAAKSFDVVASAGSLSYGDPALVDAEVHRVLRRGGMFLCVDSLNHNPVYRFNRWMLYRRGKRSESTLIRMPTVWRIQSIARGFKSINIRYFGSVSYLLPLFSRFIGQVRAAQFSDAIDRLINVRRSAFKFVLVARGRL